jgi:hypothetical protein
MPDHQHGRTRYLDEMTHDATHTLRGDTLSFWQIEAAGYEERARAEGHQVQSCLALAVTVVAGGVLAVGFDVLVAPIVAGIVAFSIWLLALIGALHWAEMMSLAAKRTASENRVGELLADEDALIFRALQVNRSFGLLWWVASGTAITICIAIFGTVFAYCLVQATVEMREFRPAFVAVALIVAVATVLLAVFAGLVRRRAEGHVRPRPRTDLPTSP